MGVKERETELMGSSSDVTELVILVNKDGDLYGITVIRSGGKLG